MAKADCICIGQFIDSLKAAPWLGEARKWWPEFLYRFDDIETAAQILNTGVVLSRNAALASGVLRKDCAHPDVIRKTQAKWKDYVRLYFRPRTPTQFVAEGFRSAADVAKTGAHCPAPVFFLFAAKQTLCLDKTEFSEGSLASASPTGSSCEYLQSIPFEKVFHDEAWSQSEARSIKFHRHAEAFYPQSLDLSTLKYVICRSQAEHETLRTLLSNASFARWDKRISVTPAVSLHFRRWTFVESVELSPERVVFRFNPDTSSPGPFHARLDITELGTNRQQFWENKAFQIPTHPFPIRLHLKDGTDYLAEFRLDGHLAYKNLHVLEVPF